MAPGAVAIPEHNTTAEKANVSQLGSGTSVPIYTNIYTQRL